MRSIIIAILLLITFSCNSQNFFTSVFGGIANYQGDLQERPYSLAHTRFAWGVGLLFELNPHLSIRGDFTTGSIRGDDAVGLKNKSRNLSFNSSITEFSVGVEYVPVDLYEYKISPYVFAGIGVFKFNPYVMASNGGKIILYEYDTEGEGFYEGRKKYKLTQACIPFGGGIQWALSNNVRVAVVGGIRKTFTDYIDDVSTTYIDRDLLVSNRGLPAAKLAYRGDELPNGDPYPPAGTKRGNPSNNDSYYFAGFSLRFRLELYPKYREPKQRKRKSSVKCPAVY